MRSFRSVAAGPKERGLEFGTAHRHEITATLSHYLELFSTLRMAPSDLVEVGGECLTAIGRYSQAAEAEIVGMAEGAGVDPAALAMINARTEILARYGPMRGECSTVAYLSRSVSVRSVQTWDWHDSTRNDWLVWTIDHGNGVLVHTLTEFGILGKIGLNTSGVGVHFNILHHESDGGAIGVPVHILARTILDRASGIGPALAMVGSAQVSASTALTIVGADSFGASAITAELYPNLIQDIVAQDRTKIISYNRPPMACSSTPITFWIPTQAPEISSRASGRTRSCA